MKFMGSKARIAKYIIPIMESYRKPGQAWVEPFVGGGNIIDKVSGKRYGCDADQKVINALIAIQTNPNLLPKDRFSFTEDDYNFFVPLATKNPINYFMICFAGFAYSYGGKWHGGWSRDKEGKRDYVAEAYRSAVKQSKGLQGVQFLPAIDYREVPKHVPKNSLYYCDPPYKGTTGYGNKFDSYAFWYWCLNLVDEGNTVFVSEYTVPDFVDVEVLWEKEICSSLTKDAGIKKGTEKLFMVKVK